MEFGEVARPAWSTAKSQMTKHETLVSGAHLDDLSHLIITWSSYRLISTLLRLLCSEQALM